jgi:anaerobic ribonucleoside-triphosphate reductase
LFTTIRKRDGREVPFDDSKITDAIFKAARAVGGEDRELAVSLTLDVLRMLKQEYNGQTFGVEDVQDVVEKVLIERGHARTAKAYILYRDKRTRIRDAKTELMDIVEDIIKETDRDNANVGNSPSAKMLQIASAASRNFYLTRLLDEDYSLAHRRGDIHIHDLDFYATTPNCLQIPLDDLLRDGFDNGHGFIRPPKRPASATALAAIILQSSQNDIYGGQSFPFFDTQMAPFIDGNSEEEVYQAMEALVYNLNSMHSLRGSERIWIFNKEQKNLSTMSMEQFHRVFEPGKYAALSLNYQNGKTELKDITASYKHNNFHRLLRVKLKSGQSVDITDNHSIMTIDETGKIATSSPKDLQRGLAPARWIADEEEHVYGLSQYPNSYKYPMKSLKLDENLAKFFGFYVAEGSFDGSSISLALFDLELEQIVTDLLKSINTNFTTIIRRDKKGKRRDLRCRVGRTFASFVADVCGRGAQNKRVPSEIFFSSPDIIKSFLDGYISGDGTVAKNRVLASTVSQELRDGIYLLMVRCGLPVSIDQETPVSQFANARERFKIAVGGYYATSLSVSGRKEENLADLYQVTTEQTKYDYEYLRPLIAEVYGIKCRNAYQYRIRPLYIEELIFDLEYRILKPEEKKHIEQLASKEYWLKQVEKIIPAVKSTERYHLKRLIKNNKLPRFSKYLDVKFPYTQFLERFILPENLGLHRIGGRINDDCNSPLLVIRWANKVLEKNEIMQELLCKLKRAQEILPLQVKSINELPYEPYVYDISVADNENFLTAKGVFVHNSRAGSQVPFSSLNLGTDTSETGRKVTRNLLLAYEAGLGKGENPIFPNVIFRLKKGINFDPGDPNYDLFQLAVRVASKRLNPTFSFMDSSFNKKYGDQVAYMGCRTRVMANRRGPAVTTRRGNLSFTTINLPRLAIKAERNIKRFYSLLDELTELTINQLYHRFNVQCRLRVKDIPFVMGQGLYMGSEDLKPEDSIEPAIVNGTLSVGMIGLAEALIALTGYHHGQSEESQALGLEIMQHISEKVEDACERFDLNYTFLATPAEGLCGRFVTLDRKEFELIPGVTDREYYTNSFHIPVHYPISMYDKIRLEGQYHKYFNAGHISYVELPSPPQHNPQAVEALIRHMADCDMGYAGINYPVDFCCGCSLLGVFNDPECPRCGSTNIRRVRRITGYLSTVDRFNDGKVAELRDRLPHSK